MYHFNDYPKTDIPREGNVHFFNNTLYNISISFKFPANFDHYVNFLFSEIAIVI